MTTIHPTPYGAAELKRVARAHMAKAVSLGSGLWIGVFALAMTASLLVPKPVVVPYESFAQPILVEPPPLVEPLNYDVPTTRPPLAQPSEGSLDVVDDVLPPPDPARDGPWFDPTLPVGPVGSDPPAPPGGMTVAPSGDGLAPETPWIYHDEPPVAVSTPRPEYPDLARQAGVEGTVRLLVHVGVDGRVRGAKVVASVPLLDAAALEGIQRWTFTPAFANGHPVAVWVAVPVVFRLH